MATADHQQHLGQGTSWAPDSLPMGTDIMPWAQAAARHILPNRARIDEILRIAGYRGLKVIEVIGGLLHNIQKDPTSKDLNIWHYRPEGSDTGMGAHLHGEERAVILTTTPHRNTGWEMQAERVYDTDALAEYNDIYGKERLGYKFKMVIYDPGPKNPESPKAPERKEGVHDLAVLAKATQADRKLPWLGMKPQDWRYNYKGIPARFALMYQTIVDGENDVWVRLSHPDDGQTSELYRFIQREPGRAHVVVRVVNFNRPGF